MLSPGTSRLECVIRSRKVSMASSVHSVSSIKATDGATHQPEVHSHSDIASPGEAPRGSALSSSQRLSMNTWPRPAGSGVRVTLPSSSTWQEEVSAAGSFGL